MSEVAELQRKIDHLQQQITTLERHLVEQRAAARDLAEQHFQALLAALGRSNAETELTIVKAITPLAEQVAALQVSRS